MPKKEMVEKSYFTIRKFQIEYLESGDALNEYRQIETSDSFTGFSRIWKWTLQINEGFVDVHLEQRFNEIYPESPTNISVSILDGEGKVFHKKEAHHRFKKDEPVFGWPQFCLTRDLLCNSNLKDPFKILCEFSYCPNAWEFRPVPNPEKMEHFATGSAGTGSFQGGPFFAPNVHACSQMLSDQFGALLIDPKFADVTLCIGEMEFPAHKAILAVRCPVFEAMFERDMLEKRQNKVEINDVEPQILKEMLEFIYTGKAPNIDDIAQDMLVVADRYLVDQLKALAEGSLARKLSITNATDLLMLADSCSAENLFNEAIKFIGSNLGSVMKQSNWYLVKEKSELMHHILEFMAVNYAKINKS